MLCSTVHLDVDEDFILSEVTRRFETPLIATRETVHGDGTLTFIADAGGARDGMAAQLRESDAISQVGEIGDSMVLVRKRSCGAIPIIQRHNGLLYGLDYAYGTERVFEILTFTREEIRAIVDGFDEIGTAHLDRIVQVPDRPAGLSKRQYEAVEAALEAGYYDWPRGTDVEQIAADFGVTHPTFLEHLRKAEKKLITAALPSRSVSSFEERSEKALLQTDSLGGTGTRSSVADSTGR